MQAYKILFAFIMALVISDAIADNAIETADNQLNSSLQSINSTTASLTATLQNLSNTASSLIASAHTMNNDITHIGQSQQEASHLQSMRDHRSYQELRHTEKDKRQSKNSAKYHTYPTHKITANPPSSMWQRFVTWSTHPVEKK